MPNEEEIALDDELHFQALRGTAKSGEDNTQSSKYGEQEEVLSGSCNLRSVSHTNGGEKEYKPKKNTEPYHILEAMYKLGGYERAVTKGQNNEAFFNEGREKIRLWYYLSIKLR
jgi:hypothetical protein